MSADEVAAKIINTWQMGSEGVAPDTKIRK